MNTFILKKGSKLRNLICSSILSGVFDYNNLRFSHALPTVIHCEIFVIGFSNKGNCVRKIKLFVKNMFGQASAEKVVGEMTTLLANSI